MTPAERFWNRVATPDSNGCRLWLGCDWPSGYGRVSIHGKGWFAHRWAWVLTYGPIPQDKIIMHRCDVRMCVEPTHLQLGTRADNNADRHAKGRDARQRGEDNGMSVLTSRQAWAVRQLYPCPFVTLQSLADQLGVSKKAIHLIVTDKTWL